MTRRAMSLMDVLAPPGNDWLRALSGCKAELPAGVRIVRFCSAADDESSDDDEGAGKPTRRRQQAAA